MEISRKGEGSSLGPGGLGGVLLDPEGIHNIYWISNKERERGKREEVEKKRQRREGRRGGKREGEGERERGREKMKNEEIIKDGKGKKDIASGDVDLFGVEMGVVVESEESERVSRH